MAGYRQFHTKFWKDGWVIELDPLERYLFTYLFTNEQSSISGIFELPFRIILNETGLDREFIQKTLDKFQRSQKIFYKDGIMWIVKMRQHHKNASPLTMKKVNADVDLIPDCDVKAAYRYHELTGKYCIDMVSIRTSLSRSLNKDEAEEKPEETPLYPLSPEIEVYREITGLVPDIVKEPEVIRNIQEIRSRLKQPPRDVLLETMREKYTAWCETRSGDGRPYNPSNPGWLEWCITGYVPQPQNNHSNRLLPDGV